MTILTPPSRICKPIYGAPKEILIVGTSAAKPPNPVIGDAGGGGGFATV